MNAAQLFWQGDGVTKFVALLLLAMSVGSWVVIAVNPQPKKFSHDQVRLNIIACIAKGTCIRDNPRIDAFGNLFIK